MADQEAIPGPVRPAVAASHCGGAYRGRPTRRRYWCGAPVEPARPPTRPSTPHRWWTPRRSRPTDTPRPTAPAGKTLAPMRLRTAVRWPRRRRPRLPQRPRPKRPRAAIVSSGSCDASYYDGRRATASGEQFDATDLTAGHRNLPFDTRVRVINVANGESVIVRINDRGPYHNDRCLNLSEAAFDTIADLGSGVIDVRYEVLVEDAT